MLYPLSYGRTWNRRMSAACSLTGRSWQGPVSAPSTLAGELADALGHLLRGGAVAEMGQVLAIPAHEIGEGRVVDQIAAVGGLGVGLAGVDSVGAECSGDLGLAAGEPHQARRELG